MTTHPFWGKVEQDWAGYSAEITFYHPFFKNSGVEIFLGEEFDEDGEEIESPPTAEMLLAFARTYKNFLDNIENNLIAIQQAAFDRYQKIYAKYYEAASIGPANPQNRQHVTPQSPYQGNPTHPRPG